MLSADSNDQSSREPGTEETQSQRLFTPFDCLVIGSGWERIKGDKPPMSWDGQTINKLLSAVAPDKELVASYIPALRELTEIYSKDQSAIYGGFNLVAQRALLLCQQVLQAGSVVEALDPRTEYAKTRGYTISPQDAKRLVKNEARSIHTIIERLEARAAKGGVLDVAELDMLRGSVDGFVEALQCCEWEGVINSATMAADYVRNVRQGGRKTK